MGCGASKVTPQSGEDIKPTYANGKTGVGHDLRSNGHANGNTHGPKSSDGKVKDSHTKPSSAVPNGNIHVNSLESKDVSNQQPLDKQSDLVVTNEENHASLPPPTSKAVAFDIVFGDADKLSPLINRPPRRLKKIESAPVLTMDALKQKQAAAEQNRQKELGKKVKLMSKRRSELLIAREMDKAQQQKAELEEKLNAASERKREKTQAEVILKQKRREEKAKRVRTRAQQMKEGDDVIGLDIDHDDTYNADEEDESWDIATPQSACRSGDLNDGNNNQRLDDKESAEPEIKNSEHRTEEQRQHLNDVLDFFDS